MYCLNIRGILSSGGESLDPISMSGKVQEETEDDGYKIRTRRH